MSKIRGPPKAQTLRAERARVNLSRRRGALTMTQTAALRSSPAWSSTLGPRRTPAARTAGAALKTRRGKNAVTVNRSELRHSAEGLPAALTKSPRTGLKRQYVAAPAPSAGCSTSWCAARRRDPTVQAGRGPVQTAAAPAAAAARVVLRGEQNGSSSAAKPSADDTTKKARPASTALQAGARTCAKLQQLPLLPCWPLPLPPRESPGSSAPKLQHAQRAPRRLAQPRAPQQTASAPNAASAPSSRVARKWPRQASRGIATEADDNDAAEEEDAKVTTRLLLVGHQVVPSAAEVTGTASVLPRSSLYGAEQSSALLRGGLGARRRSLQLPRRLLLCSSFGGFRRYSWRPAARFTRTTDHKTGPRSHFETTCAPPMPTRRYITVADWRGVALVNAARSAGSAQPFLG
jgi:hypothetical protein